MEFDCVGRVRPVRPEDTFSVGEIPTKVAMVVCNQDCGPTLVYFDAKRCPQVGTRVGARGGWVCMRERATTKNTPPGFPISGETYLVEYQLDVEDWQRVSADYDWLFDRLAS